MTLHNLLRASGIGLVITSVAGTVMATLAVNKLSEHSIYYLNRFYGQENHNTPDYSALFRYAREITDHRNLHAFLLVVVGGSLLFTIGVLLIALAKRYRD